MEYYSAVKSDNVRTTQAQRDEPEKHHAEGTEAAHKSTNIVRFCETKYAEQAESQRPKAEVPGSWRWGSGGRSSLNGARVSVCKDEKVSETGVVTMQGREGT